MNTTSLLIETKSPKSQHAQIFRLPNNNIFVKCRAWPPGLLLCLYKRCRYLWRCRQFHKNASEGDWGLGREEARRRVVRCHVSSHSHACFQHCINRHSIHFNNTKENRITSTIHTFLQFILLFILLLRISFANI